MSKDEIAYRIRLMFYSIFGVIFAFLFIATSSYLKLSEQASIKQSNVIVSNLLEGLKLREKNLYEEFVTENDESIKKRIAQFLQSQLISGYEIQLIRSANCIRGNESLCELSKKFNLKDIKKTSYFALLGKIHLIVPMQGWGETLGFISVDFPQSEVSAVPSLYQKITLYILPFTLLAFLVLCFYLIAEKRIIRPTIKRIIETEKMKAQQAIIRQFAHDIKSPVCALESVLSVEKFSNTDSSEVVQEALGRINAISTDLLDWDRSFLRVEDVEIRKLLSSIINEKLIQFKDRNLVIKYIVDDQIRSININTLDFYRVISNLLNNSIESTPNSISIEISVMTYLDGVKVAISDNGSGIHSEKIPSILSGQYSSKSKGNGLGISGARLWAEKLNGFLSINSQVGLGTTIELTLPVSVV